ncbi:MAG TPA: cation transporter [Bryocella sp.]|nr:cation transporter [Bryocella sp.]
MAGEQTLRHGQLQRGITLEYLTLGWNLVEGIVAIASGAVAGSVALIGFGVDSFIEMGSGGVLLWRLRAEKRGAVAADVERRALRLVGVSFLLLAAYVAFESVKSLVERAAPEHSVPGICIAGLSLVVMPWLAHQKRAAAGGLNSGALHADSRQSSLCAYLSAILLGGLVLNAAFGWWWADPIAALLMVPLIAFEGIEALKAKTCCQC